MPDETTPAPLSHAEIAAASNGTEMLASFVPRMAEIIAAQSVKITAQTAQIAAYRSALADVLAAADGSVGLYTPSEHPSVTRARALLASTTPATGATAGEGTCDLCNGTGVYVGEIAWENPDGTVGTETKRITCHGCNGTGKRKPNPQQSAD